MAFTSFLSQISLFSYLLTPTFVIFFIDVPVFDFGVFSVDQLYLGHPRFFLGTDSAPHPRHMKEQPISCAGIFTSLHLLPTLAHALESFNALDQLLPFACSYGRAFYGSTLFRRAAEQSGYQGQWEDGKRGSRVLVRRECVVSDIMRVMGDNGEVCAEVVPFMAGQTLHWTLE